MRPPVPSPRPTDTLTRTDAPDDAVARLALIVAAATPLDDAAAAVTAIGSSALHADGCAVTVTRADDDRSGELPLVQSTTTLAGSVARLELVLEEGPTHASRERHRPCRTSDVRVEQRWPRWARRAAGLGVRSTLVVDVPGDDLDAALLWVSDRPGHFDEQDEWAARRFATAAAAALHSSQIAADLRRQQANLERALHSRATIDQAIGVLVARNGGTPDDAWQRLRTISRREGVKVAEIARRTVEQASRQHARAATRAGPLASARPLG